MGFINLNDSKISNQINEKEINNLIDENKRLISDISTKGLKKDREKSYLGWMDLDKTANDKLIQKINKKAKEIRNKAEVFLLIGVGGSNQAARAAIKAFSKSENLEILYTGNNVSSKYINKILDRIKNKSIYVNIIAKNFATLEPGICFRAVRNFMEKKYGEKEASKRITATGSPNESTLKKLADSKNYMFLPFPLNVGGRFSVFSAVGLLPMAVGGVSIEKMLEGASEIKSHLQKKPLKNDAVKYAVVRNLLLNKGKDLEILSYFEPQLKYFSKWWIQLFAESEGKDGKGIFPTACSFTEDLHSLGQYIQSGQRILFETFLNIEKINKNYVVPSDSADDHFDYLEGKDFEEINKAAFRATLEAHVEGGVPSLIINVPELTPYYMGQLFYFFEMAVYISGKILGINPFNQPGVESYKKNMFSALGKE